MRLKMNTQGCQHARIHCIRQACGRPRPICNLGVTSVTVSGHIRRHTAANVCVSSGRTWFHYFMIHYLDPWCIKALVWKDPVKLIKPLSEQLASTTQALVSLCHYVLTRAGLIYQH